MEQLKSLFADVFSSIPMPGIMDVLDMAVVAFLIYRLLNMIRTTSAYRIAKAIVIFMIVYGVTGFLHMYALNFILKTVLEVGLIALVIMFQPELRRALDRLGGNSLQDLLAGKPAVAQMTKVINETAAACEAMGREKVGALIVFERKNPLEEIIQKGTVLEAEVSDTLLRSIFFPKAALHDGAVIIRGGKVAGAGCVLPLTEKSLSRDLGTRHRAGIGMSEETDAVVVIVSEETGTISVAVNGMLKRHLTGATLARLLTNELVSEEEPKGSYYERAMQLIRKYWKKKDEDHAEK